MSEINSVESRTAATIAGRGATKTALLIIDPVNDFLSPEGAAWELTKSTVEMNKVVPNLKRLMSGARERGVPLLIGPPWGHRSAVSIALFHPRMRKWEQKAFPLPRLYRVCISRADDGLRRPLTQRPW